MGMTVAALCVATNSTYRSMADVECYDIKRDARTFPGGMPIVAHPPCRAWSATTRHQAKPEPGEKELGLWCCDMLRKCGGVLEQPAHSHLFEAAGLPLPGDGGLDGVWSLAVWQSWWGYPMKKGTWLAFCGINPTDVHVPLVLHARGRDRRRQQVMSKNQRAATCPEFAKWLVGLARKSNIDQRR